MYMYNAHKVFLARSQGKVVFLLMYRVSLPTHKGISERKYELLRMGVFGSK